MSVSRILSRFGKPILAQSRATTLSLSFQKHNPSFLSNQFHTLGHPQNKFITRQSPLSTLNASVLQRFGFSSSASPETNEKDPSQNGGENVASVEESGDSTNVESKNTEKTDSDSEDELSMDDMVKLVAEKDELLQSKKKEIEIMKDKVLRTYAEMENVMDRTKREAESSKKFAIQSFAKNLLDVADNLDRASAVVKDGFSKLDESKESTGALPLLKTLLEGVEMTDKQLIKVFKEYGVEKYYPINEQFDPNLHNAAFQISDASKPANTVAVVLKSGYMLHDRVLRPAEVGVTVDEKESDA